MANTYFMKLPVAIGLRYTWIIVFQISIISTYLISKSIATYKREAKILWLYSSQTQTYSPLKLFVKIGWSPDDCLGQEKLKQAGHSHHSSIGAFWLHRPSHGGDVDIHSHPQYLELLESFWRPNGLLQNSDRPWWKWHEMTSTTTLGANSLQPSEFWTRPRSPIHSLDNSGLPPAHRDSQWQLPLGGGRVPRVPLLVVGCMVMWVWCVWMYA